VRTSAPPTRRQRLDLAARSLTRGRARTALTQYLALLEQPPDPAIHLKVAELYVKLKQPGEARSHFDAAAARFAQQGFEQRELAVYRTAVASMPREVELWERVADWQRDHGYPAEALRTLLDGRRTFSRGRFRAEAVRLLRAALALDPGHLPATFDLARLLAKMGERAEARQLYEGVAAGSKGASRRRARRCLFLLSPTPVTAWRWLRAVLTGS
jgi:tetratricopeptide (TPR) repeat protein